jgi:large subunit ribosomal protein L10
LENLKVLLKAEFFIMPKTKEQKKKIVEEIREKIKKAKTIVLLDFTGVKSPEFLDLRKKIKKLKKDLKVAKKTLTQIAFKEEKIDFDVRKLEGQLALAFGEKEDLPLIKAIFEKTKEVKNLKILGGFLEKEFLSAEKIIELAKLPTKEELLAKFIGTLSASISNFIFVLSAIPQNFVFVLSQIKGQKEK